MKSVKFGKLKEQRYAMKESLRALKTNIQFCGDDIRTIVITSALPNEGKSTVTLDLARSLTESGKRVLLIDTDMRKSVYVGRLRALSLDGEEIYGLSHFLSGQKNLEEVLYGTEIPGLFMIFAGPTVPNPTEILEKRYFDDLLKFGREHFNYVLLDCAPIGAAIDAAVIAKHCDGAILVIAQGTASGRMILSVKKQLEASGVRILGAVLNKVRMKKSNYDTGYYGGYYGSYYGSYYGGGDGSPDSKERDAKEA
ncbi:MAG: CpsD/CapB family tyrosine-protein kinase [Clostridiales bacterium]|nr:CpsD/CapB family tyrosine-protein kinase [Clostridiales bacterium]